MYLCKTTAITNHCTVWKCTGRSYSVAQLLITQFLNGLQKKLQFYPSFSKVHSVPENAFYKIGKGRGGVIIMNKSAN